MGRDDQTNLMTSAGFEAGRHSFLVVARPDPAGPTPDVPPGLSVTRFDPETAEELRLAHTAAFADHPHGTPMGADFWGMFMVRAAHNRHHLSTVARDGAGDVAGYVTASLNVDTANPTGTLGLYERAGFEQLYRQDFYRLEEPPV